MAKPKPKVYPKYQRENIRLVSKISRDFTIRQLIGDYKQTNWLVFEQIVVEIMDRWKFRHIKLASKISEKVFVLGTWTLVS